MASRPVFIPTPGGAQLAYERSFEFKWASGFAESQKKKNIVALHNAARHAGLDSVLEISTKSDVEVGRRLSAFSLKVILDGIQYPLESVYQSSKVFERQGPFPQILAFEPRESKRFIREIDAGNLVGFELEGRRFPLSPKNAFYDWLYIRALAGHSEWIAANVDYDGYTDIEFNPEKQVNCQARAFAELKSLSARSELDTAAADFDYFASRLPPI